MTETDYFDKYQKWNVVLFAVFLCTIHHPLTTLSLSFSLAFYARLFICLSLPLSSSVFIVERRAIGDLSSVSNALLSLFATQFIQIFIYSQLPMLLLTEELTLLHRWYFVQKSRGRSRSTWTSKYTHSCRYELHASAFDHLIADNYIQTIPSHLVRHRGRTRRRMSTRSRMVGPRWMDSSSFSDECRWWKRKR